MIKKTMLALLLGSSVLMTACSGNAGGTDVKEVTDGMSGAESGSTEAESAAAAEDDNVYEEIIERDVFEMPKEEGELVEEGNLTIRLDGGTVKEGFSWSYYQGDKGDASLVELLADSDMDGGVYVGSFRALPDAGDGDDYVRLVYTNGVYTCAYIDVDVEVKDHKIVSYAFTDVSPLDSETAESLLEGTWQQQDDGPMFMEITANPVDGFDVVISDGSGRDGNAVYNTMTVYYDILKQALVYVDGTVNQAAITDGQEESSSEISEPGGNGAFSMIFDESTGSLKALDWIDMSDSHDVISFEKQ